MSHDPLVFHEQGDANEYCLVTEGGKWVIAFRMNGEMLTSRQIEIGRRMVACFNACAGMTDAVVRDAERYRWLAGSCKSADEPYKGGWSIHIQGPVPRRHDEEDSFDEAIDAAIAAAKGEK